MNKDPQAFWQTWKAKFGTRKTNRPTVNVDGSCDSKVVAEKFANIFESVCKPNNVRRYNRMRDNFLYDIDNYRVTNNSKIDLDLSLIHI